MLMCNLCLLAAGAQFILHREEGISETVVMKLEGEGVDMCVRWTPTKQTLKSKSEYTGMYL